MEEIKLDAKGESASTITKTEIQKKLTSTNNRAQTLLALLLLIVACAFGLLYAYIPELIPLNEVTQISNSVDVQTELEKEELNYIPVFDIRGIQTALISKDEPYYDFTRAFGKDHRLPFEGYPATGSFVFDSARNYRFRLDENWEFSTVTPILPDIFKNPRYTLKDKGSSCYVTFAEEDVKNPYEAGYTQVMYSYGFASIFEPQLPVQRMIKSDDLPADYSQTWDVSPWQPFMQHEFSYTHANRVISQSGSTAESVLVMHSSDDTPLTEACDRAFVGMLRTIEPWYSTQVLTPATSGTITLLNEYINEGAILELNGGEQRFTRVLLDVEDQKNEQFQVTTLKDVSSTVVPAIYKNMLYYMQNGTGLVSLNLFENVETVLIRSVSSTSPDGQKKELTVSDYYFTDDTLYTLQGVLCDEYNERCNLSLISSLHDGSGQVALATNVPYRDIVGYEESEQQLYLRRVDGDAGCAWGEYAVYNLKLKTIVPLQDISGCYEDGVKPSGVQYIESIAKKFESQVRYITTLKILEGLISPVITENGDKDTWYQKMGERIRYIN